MDMVIQVGAAPCETDRIAAAAAFASRMTAKLHGVFLSAAPAPAALAARDAFLAATGRAGALADWMSLPPGSDDAWLARARQADLVIAANPETDDRDEAARSHGLAPDRLSAACERPVLILPAASTNSAIGRCVLVAWDDSPEAWRALDAAMPLLKAAEAIWVVSAAPNPRAFPANDRALETYLSDQGLTPMIVRRCAPNIARAIAGEAQACGADLVVMGALAWRQVADRPPSGRVRGAPGRKTLAQLIVC